MGRPYEKDLLRLDGSYGWARGLPVEGLATFLGSAVGAPLVITGSGGSYTAACMAELLHQRSGGVAKAVTPLELTSANGALRGASILVMSAGGRNTDALAAFRFAVAAEPIRLAAVCLRMGSPLVALARRFDYAESFEFPLPGGKDGFLATNSLVAFLTILIRSYARIYTADWNLDDSLLKPASLDISSSRLPDGLLKCDTWVVLYGSWGRPAAVDLESKFSEAALGRVMLVDYRSFAHGRHLWLAKRPHETAVVALMTPGDESLTRRTLSLLPKGIPTHVLSTGEAGPVGSLHLVTKAMTLVNQVGLARGIDPGRPGVPTFGRKIYRLAPSLGEVNGKRPKGMTQQECAAILRKSHSSSIEGLSQQSLAYWRRAYHEFISALRRAEFGGVVLDYDGTLCGRAERFGQIRSEIAHELLRLLRRRCVVAVVTGRGQSVRRALRDALPERYWKDLLVGYYNGADIAPLDDSSHPDRAEPLHEALRPLETLLSSHQLLAGLATIESRPRQITVEPRLSWNWNEVRRILADIVPECERLGVRLLESSHSIDVVSPGVSKLNLVKAAVQQAGCKSLPTALLRIGDRGERPGNDHALLSGDYSLSVDAVSPDPRSCWNLGAPGSRGVQTTLGYLTSVSIAASGQFSFLLEGTKR